MNRIMVENDGRARPRGRAVRCRISAMLPRALVDGHSASFDLPGDSWWCDLYDDDPDAGLLFVLRDARNLVLFRARDLDELERNAREAPEAHRAAAWASPAQ